MDTYAIYLRKSRADVEAEARGEGETLARHRRALTELAEKRGYYVAKVYQEIVSGDSIEARPQMQALLAEVEAGVYRGVIVNDADRLARGDSIDQGIVTRAFFATGTLIITPVKIYDPSNPTDTDFFEFGLFMARFEYRKINQRMQTGRLRSAAEGNYLATRITYGYKKAPRKDRGGFMLVPDPDKADIVRMVYNLYANGENGETFGADKIARRLNDMGVKTDLGNPFTAGFVRWMLKNPNYIGAVIWNKKVKRVKFVNGEKIIEREKNNDPIIVYDAHEPIIDRALFDRVQEMFASHAKLPKNTLLPVLNPLAGLLFCSVCGKRMQIHYGPRSRDKMMLRCVTQGCPTVRSYLPIVEAALMDALRKWDVEYSEESEAPTTDPTDDREPQKRVLDQSIATLTRQLDALHDLLEQGIYTPSDFVRRRSELNERIDAAKKQREALETKPTRREQIIAVLPQVRETLAAYPMAETAELKNKLLRTCISRIDYAKTKHCYRNDNPADYLTLTLYPSTFKI